MADRGTVTLEPDSSRLNSRSGRPPAGQVTCPTCRTKTAWQGNPQRPFCSLTCRLIDLGQWLDEHYRIPPAAADDVS
jgi:endogenous inhibitor of DNA gyrase (YacG/DUF329 family)